MQGYRHPNSEHIRPFRSAGSETTRVFRGPFFPIAVILYVGALAILSGVCAPRPATSLDTHAPLTMEELSTLSASGEIQSFKVQITGSADVARIRTAGVLIMTREPEYVVILGDEKRIQAVRSLGFLLQEPVESDHRPRSIRVWVSTREEMEKVDRLMSDTWPAILFPGHVYGRAFDHQIEWLHDRGYAVELCDPKGGCTELRPRSAD